MQETTDAPQLGSLFGSFSYHEINYKPRRDIAILAHSFVRITSAPPRELRSYILNGNPNRRRFQYFQQKISYTAILQSQFEYDIYNV